MNIFILNGTYGNRYKSILDRFIQANNTHNVQVMDLENASLAYCSGCWSCWTKTPGLCAHQEDTQDMLKKVINADYVIHFTENSVGYVTSLTKKAMDKLIPLVHPYMEFVDGELHHIKRYEKYPKMGLIYVDETQNEMDFKQTTHLLTRMALNFKTTLPFAITIDGKDSEAAYENFSL